MNKPAVETMPIGALGSLFALAECMRPVQWIKNTFVLSALLFSSNLGSPSAVHAALVIFAAFCGAASGIYLWNDSLDWRADLIHPEKRNRPIPSGRLSPYTAMAFGSILLVCSIVAGYLLNYVTGTILLIYVLTNYSYTLWLKKMVILDIMCIAMGFVFRVMAGASAINVKASHWLLMCTFLLALFLGIAKRKHEIATLARDSGKHRQVLDSYSMEWLDQASTIVCGATIVAYALYTVSPETEAKVGTDHLIYTLPLVTFGILRYLHMIHSNGRTGNPTAAIISDKPLLVCLFGWAAACAAIIY